MHIFSAVFFALCANLDNLVIGVSYGMKGIHISMNANLVIGLVTFVGTIASMLLGKVLLLVIPFELASVIGSTLLIFMGLYCLISYHIDKGKKEQDDNVMRQSEENESVGTSKAKLRDIVFLGFVLAINNIGLGIGASIVGIGIIPTSIASFLFSMLFIGVGNRFGALHLSKKLGDYAEPVSGLIIIMLGVFELFL